MFRFPGTPPHARFIVRLAVVAVLASLTHGSAEQHATGVPHERYQHGVDLLDQGRFAEALPLYRAQVNENPYDGWNWLGLAWSLHYTGDCAGAQPAYERALTLGAQPPYRLMHEIARCSVSLGRHREALDWIQEAIEAGLPNLAALRRDEALAPLADMKEFQSLVHVPSASGDRTTRWREDLRLLTAEIKRLHYTKTGYAHSGALDRDVDALSRQIPELDDDALALGVMRITRRLGDGHSWAVPPFMASGSEEALPLLFGYFEEGIFVTAAAPGHEDLLWSRVLAFDRTPTARVFDAVAAIVPQDNSWRPRALAPMRMRFPRLLAALGLTEDNDAITLTVADRHGVERVVRVPSRSTSDINWVRRPADAAASLPEHVRRRSDHYSFERDANTGTIYLQYNACQQKRDEPMEAFAARLSSALADGKAERLVVDLRWNGGGNQFVSRPLLKAILQSPVNRRGRLFVLAGPHTFSAAIVFGAELERYAEAIFIGEPTGASPNFVGETNRVRLPHSGIEVSISDLFWQNSFPRDSRTWIPPLLYVPARFADYRAGRDPVRAAAMTYPAGRSTEPPQ